MNKQNKLFHNDNPTLSPFTKGRIKEGALHNDNNGYVMIITLLSLVALTIAGMGAMMVATTDISLSGNQRTQIAAKEASITGVNTGMANLCSRPFMNAANPNFVSTNVNSTVLGAFINTPPSSPQAAFYNGIYSTPVPTSNAGSNYAVGYYLATPANASSSSITPLSSAAPSPSGPSVSRASTFPDGLGSGGKAYKIGPVIGMVGTTTMECERTVYYGSPQ